MPVSSVQVRATAAALSAVDLQNKIADLLTKLNDPDMITAANAGGGASYTRTERVKIMDLLELYQLALEFKQTGRIGKQADLAQFTTPIAVRFPL
jgi:hypothetical protein